MAFIKTPLSYEDNTGIIARCLEERVAMIDNFIELIVFRLKEVSLQTMISALNIGIMSIPMFILKVSIMDRMEHIVMDFTTR